jgi:hypothetical protein
MLLDGRISPESDLYSLWLSSGAARKEGLNQLTSSRIEKEWNALVPIEARIGADKEPLQGARVLGAFLQRGIDQELD